MLEKLQKGIISLRFSILSIFVSLFCIAFLLLIGITYVRYTHALTYLAMELMQKASATAHNELDNTLNAASHAEQFSARLIQHGILDTSNQTQMLSYMSHLLNSLPYVQAVGWGDEAGNFLFNEKVTDGTVETEIFKTHPALHQRLKHDHTGKVIENIKSTVVNYDPRTRPWYIVAKQLKKQAWTSVYIYRFENMPGISVAMPIYQTNNQLKGVFLIDMRLDYLSKFISTDQVSAQGITYIVTPDNKIVALPKTIKQEETKTQQMNLIDVHSLKERWVGRSFDIYKKTGMENFKFSYKGENYLAAYQTIKHFAFSGWVIGVVVPQAVFIGQLQKTNLINFILSLGILFFGIWLVSLLVNRVVTPLDDLTKETEKIKRFELTDDHPATSRIREIITLSNAIYSMKMGLRSFQKYVPAELVRNLMKSSQNAKISGRKKELAIFFSDIENFTSIAEKMDPAQLMDHICEYLDVLSRVIVAEKGTIDKYIGDSVMAFWGAPLPEKQPAQRAARAALTCTKRLDELNQKWQQEGKPRFNTRIGVHIGDAIVGNLGSAERLNYTAIGDSVNMASRLEGINKIYGTRIVVSDAMYRILENDFVLRMLDCIQVKGKESSSFIYELLGMKGDSFAFNVDEYRVAFEAAFKAYQQQLWDEAIRGFEACLSIYADDKVAHVFIERCQRFKQSPPAREWNGVWRVDSKM